MMRIQEIVEYSPDIPGSVTKTVNSYQFCMETTLCGKPDGKFVKPDGKFMGVGYLHPTPENPVTIASQTITSVAGLIQLVQSNALQNEDIVTRE